MDIDFDFGPVDVRVLDAVTLLCRATGARGVDPAAIVQITNPHYLAMYTRERLDKLVSHGLLIRTSAGGYGPAKLRWIPVCEIDPVCDPSPGFKRATQ